MVPQKITADQIGAIIAETFKKKKEIVCYLGSNAATPTASIEALTAGDGPGPLQEGTRPVNRVP